MLSATKYGSNGPLGQAVSARPKNVRQTVDAARGEA